MPSRLFWKPVLSPSQRPVQDRRGPNERSQESVAPVFRRGDDISVQSIAVFRFVHATHGNLRGWFGGTTCALPSSDLRVRVNQTTTGDLTMNGLFIPRDLVLHTLARGRPQPVTTAALFAGRRVVLVGLPGAFTPTCTSAHVPRYVELLQPLRAAGVDDVVIVSVNDAFVMDAWQTSLQAGALTFVADGNAELTRALDMVLDKRDLGFGLRSRRYAAVSSRMRSSSPTWRAIPTRSPTPTRSCPRCLRARGSRRTLLCSPGTDARSATRRWPRSTTPAWLTRPSPLHAAHCVRSPAASPPRRSSSTESTSADTMPSSPGSMSPATRPSPAACSPSIRGFALRWPRGPVQCA